jgi:glycerol uptake facilitator protein
MGFEPTTSSLGTGAVHTAVLTGAQVGLWQVAIVWGIAVTLAIYAAGGTSGAHLNPAITIALTVFRQFPWAKVVPYIIAQVLGAFLASLVPYALFANIIRDFETRHALVRGQPGSERSAMIYGEYFPNPAMFAEAPDSSSLVSHSAAALAEAIGTAFLAFVVFAVTDPANPGRPHETMFAVFIGVGVAIIVSVVAPLTQAGLNPARDFGPRLFSYFAGWNAVAIPGPRGGFLTVYIVSPIIGALAGAAGYRFLIKPGYPKAVAS